MVVSPKPKPRRRTTGQPKKARKQDIKTISDLAKAFKRNAKKSW